MKKILTIAIYVLCFCITSCNTNVGEKNTQAVIDEKLVANVNNPYDVIGQMHNAALAAVMSDINSSSKELSISDITELSYQHSKQLLDQHKATRGISINELDMMTEEEVLALLEDMDNNLENFIAALDLSDVAKKEMNDVVTTVLNCENSDNLTYDELYTKIVEFESKLVAQPPTVLPEKDQTALLCGTSTMRYSLAYWEESECLLKTKAPRRWWQWLIIGIVDAAGAVGGVCTGMMRGGVADAVASGLSTAVTASSTATTFIDKW